MVYLALTTDADFADVTSVLLYLGYEHTNLNAAPWDFPEWVNRGGQVFKAGLVNDCGDHRRGVWAARSDYSGAEVSVDEIGSDLDLIREKLSNLGNGVGCNQGLVGNMDDGELIEDTRFSDDCECSGFMVSDSGRRE